GDYIWIQDYHLMLAPARIRERLPTTTMAHFWHIPWPAMEVFRILPWARDLLEESWGAMSSDFTLRSTSRTFSRVRGSCSVHKWMEAQYTGEGERFGSKRIRSASMWSVSSGCRRPLTKKGRTF